MKKHNGMRPQDIVILLKIISKRKKKWLMKNLADELKISASEISESLNRSLTAGLLGKDKKKVNKLALMDFLKYGFKYVFPQKPGALARGIGTAHSAPPLNSEIVSNEHYVWPFATGKLKGQAIEPLHPNVPFACLNDSSFYQLMSLTDALRVGKVREQQIAIDLLNDKIINA